MNGVASDVAVVGGGPIGSALAVALRNSGLSVLILEARPDAAGSDDPRSLALAYGSRLILERLGVWNHIEPVTPIQSIHVSQRGGYGRSLLQASELQLPALGYVARYAQLQHGLIKSVRLTNSAMLSGAEVIGIDPREETVAIQYQSGGIIHSACARLLVIADGGASTGNLAGASMREREYGQNAVVGLVETSLPHGHRAYERFTPDGPIALLPFGHSYALVWTVAPEKAEMLATLPDAQFLASLQLHFGDRAGRFVAVASRTHFPLKLRYATNPVRGRTVMLGNAAQALHPIAGQGFNLGLRDAWELADILLRSVGSDPGSEKCLESYRARRRLDRIGGITLTHSLVKIFSNDLGPLQATRGAALALLDLFPQVKRTFMQRMVFGALQ